MAKAKGSNGSNGKGGKGKKGKTSASRRGNSMSTYVSRNDGSDTPF